ncbi:MAG: bifunctional [glutamine synthetase] adenylyltransferase/[glutamine synthetase]-adenylyl-L-tyrosine phosphorylase, partial [Hyphomicrobiaceae bacterium]
MTTGERRPIESSLAERIREAPEVHDARLAELRLADLIGAASERAPELAPLLEEGPARGLLAGAASGSPHLYELARSDPAWLLHCLTYSPEANLARLCVGVEQAVAHSAAISEAMAALRRFKREAALLIGLTDLGGVWSVQQVTDALSEVADRAIGAGLGRLFAWAAERGEIAPGEGATGSGYFVLGMGKYGARELNYSSDVDLIVFYDAGSPRQPLKHETQAFFVRLTKDLVRLLQERTPDGYVFRTDLRLRPDPGATAIALSTQSALQYYESFGQNWERAAMVKARVVGGDKEAGEEFLSQLTPYVWRKYLDYAAIADIHAMKRQIHAVRGFGAIGVAGHNIKLGRGGIREIEFFVQTQQLIAGGRQPDLRVPATLAALDRLAGRGWIKPRVREELAQAYKFLRRIEHRVQMVADEQTHLLPEAGEQLDSFARFAGYSSTQDFAKALSAQLELVQRHYAALFEAVPELTQGAGNLVFAGEADDPQTVETLRQMGFSSPTSLLATIRGWHHGRYPAVRSPRARERLTEVQPLLVEALSKTADPDLAFSSFDRLLAALPTGVQLFSLLRTNPDLLRLIADIMGTAPRLARILGRRRRVLDAVLDPGFFGALPTARDLSQVITAETKGVTDHQELLDRLRVIGNEQSFIIGVRLLTGTISAGQAGGAYALLADHLVNAALHLTEREMQRLHGRIAGGEAAVLAMGKLGGGEMTASSDLDLIVVYDYPGEEAVSDGVKPLSAMQYYGRLTQRLISTLTVPTAEGELYQVDMRLRTSGQKGPVATRFKSFHDYQLNEAWTWEHMALTRARIITGGAMLTRRIESVIRQVLTRRRDRAKVAKDVREMRALIEKEKGARTFWDLKQARGGLVDLEFIAQFLELVHADKHPSVLEQNTRGALQALMRAGVLARDQGEMLTEAATLLHDLTQILR